MVHVSHQRHHRRAKRQLGELCCGRRRPRDGVDLLQRDGAAGLEGDELDDPMPPTRDELSFDACEVDEDS